MVYTDFFIIVFVATLGVFWLGKTRSIKSSLAIGGQKSLHSLPNYHGIFVAIVCTLPAILFSGLWVLFDNTIIDKLVWASLPEQFHALGINERSLIFNQITRCAQESQAGFDISSFEPAIQTAAAYLLEL